jgi:hypothetical protein
LCPRHVRVRREEQAGRPADAGRDRGESVPSSRRSGEGASEPRSKPRAVSRRCLRAARGHRRPAAAVAGGSRLRTASWRLSTHRARLPQLRELSSRAWYRQAWPLVCSGVHPRDTTTKTRFTTSI